MATLLNDQQEAFLTDVMEFVNELENQIIEGKQYWTAQEVEDRLIHHISLDIWAYRKSQGVLPGLGDR